MLHVHTSCSRMFFFFISSYVNALKRTRVGGRGYSGRLGATLFTVHTCVEVRRRASTQTHVEKSIGGKSNVCISSVICNNE